MHIQNGTTVAVVDGQKLSLFRSAGGDPRPKLHPLPTDPIGSTHKGGAPGGAAAGSGSSSDAPQDEAGFAAGVADFLNRQAIGGGLTKLLVIADPKTLGLMRKQYHAKLKEALVGEIPKDLTGQTSEDIENAIAAA